MVSSHVFDHRKNGNGNGHNGNGNGHSSNGNGNGHAKYRIDETVEAAVIEPYHPGPESPPVSVIIPTLNEAKNLQYVLPYIPTWVHEVIIVDGHSTDETVEVALEMHPCVRIVKEDRRGKGAALQAGFRAAQGDIIIMLDADGSMNPQEFSIYIGALLSGADYVKGSRFLQGGGTSDMSLFRMFGNFALTTLVKIFFGGHYTDLCYGYNAFWTRALLAMEIDATGFEVETLMNIRALRAGLKIAEIPSFESDRVFGDSNLHAMRDGWRVLKVILRERFSPKKNGVASHWSWNSESPVALRNRASQK